MAKSDGTVRRRTLSVDGERGTGKGAPLIHELPPRAGREKCAGPALAGDAGGTCVSGGDAGYNEGRRHEARISILCFLTARGGTVPEVVQQHLKEASLGELSILRLELYAAADPETAALRFARGGRGTGTA